jgi:hypothetical protein
MLELRPNCEHCNRDLPAQSTAARICSFECTFCAACVDDLLLGVCPNCGGNFVPRPIRPKAALERNPASTTRVHKAVNLDRHQPIAENTRSVPPQER